MTITPDTPEQLDFEHAISELTQVLEAPPQFEDFESITLRIVHYADDTYTAVVFKFLPQQHKVEVQTRLKSEDGEWGSFSEVEVYELTPDSSMEKQVLLVQGKQMPASEFVAHRAGKFRGGELPAMNAPEKQAYVTLDGQVHSPEQHLHIRYFVSSDVVAFREASMERDTESLPGDIWFQGHTHPNLTLPDQLEREVSDGDIKAMLNVYKQTGRSVPEIIHLPKAKATLKVEIKSGVNVDNAIAELEVLMNGMYGDGYRDKIYEFATRTINVEVLSPTHPWNKVDK